MEEIKGTEALEREIVEDAAKKAERIMRNAREEVEKTRLASAESLEKRLEELEEQKDEKLAAMEKEAFSKLPLEKTRRAARFIDAALRDSTRRFLVSLDDTHIGAWCLSELKKQVSYLAGWKIRLLYKGVDSDSLLVMETLLGQALSSALPDSGAASRGVRVESLDGTMVASLNEEQLEERLLDEHRGELASALFPAPAGEGEKR
jgi:vacuolar-type H+-ATPase subunit E/Vma4